MFGKDIKLNFHNDDVYTTGCGGIFTLMFACIVILFCMSNIGDFLNKETMQVKQSSDYNTNPSDMVFSMGDVHMIAIQMQEDNFIVNPSYNITFEYRDYQLFENGTRNKNIILIDLQPCTLDHWKNLGYGVDWELIYNQNSFQNWLCLPIGFKLKMGGTYTSEHFYHSKVSVSRCSNDTKNNENLTWKPVCKPKESVLQNENSTTQISLSIYFSNYLINANNPKNSIQKYLNNNAFFRLYPQKTFRTTDMFFTQQVINTDESLMPWQDINKQNIGLFIPNDWREQFGIVSQSETFCDIYLRRSPISTNYTRHYTKIGNLTAFIGGFMQAILVIGGFFILHYNSYQYMVDLANKIYNFDLQQNNQQQDENDHLKKKVTQSLPHNQQLQVQTIPQNHPLVQDQISKKRKSHITNRKSTKFTQDVRNIIASRQKQLDTIQIIQESNNFQLNQDIHQPILNLEQQKLFNKLGFSSRKEYLSKEFQTIISRENNLKLTIKFFINKIFCHKFFNSEQSRLVQMAIQSIRKDLDIQVILDRIKEVEKLKKVIFSDDQIVVFNFSPKPVLSIQCDMLPDRHSIENDKKQWHKIQAYEKLYDGYVNVINVIENPRPQKYNKINKRLIKALGQEMKDIFDTSKLIVFKKEDQKPIKNKLKNFFNQKLIKNLEKQKNLLLPAINDKLNEFSDHNEALNGNAKGQVYSNLVLKTESKESSKTEKPIDIIPEQNSEECLDTQKKSDTLYQLMPQSTDELFEQDKRTQQIKQIFDNIKTRVKRIQQEILNRQSIQKPSILPPESQKKQIYIQEQNQLSQIISSPYYQNL